MSEIGINESNHKFDYESGLIGWLLGIVTCSFVCLIYGCVNQVPKPYSGQHIIDNIKSARDEYKQAQLMDDMISSKASNISLQRKEDMLFRDYDSYFRQRFEYEQNLGK